ncbi:citryl-CoA lyase [Aquisalimonas lutea]|uniref:citryl-CoA lyase n=1 Tax=Aquisalimonas lutea TaxID=1327750 RepID=UPI0025B40696|nr:citryl-CoA lyase [Aquisalimonas lutea]MDN3519560.1 citryl-CoA lyase [Aquisalimonas lutea]
MQIGKGGAATTAICTADAASITIRERDLCGDLMGGMSFTEYFYFLVTGRQAGDQQRYFLDLLLVAIAEHGLTPTAQAARMTYDADPQSLQSAVAAGILGCGSVVLGTSEACGRVLVEARERVAAGEDTDAVVHDMARTSRAAGERFPGFGHPLHRPVDPRAQRILELAEQRGVDGAHLQLARAFPAAVEAAWGKPLPMNVSMPIAAVLLDLDFPAAMVKAVPLLARTAGILAHLAEEQGDQIGFLMASHAEAAVDYVPGGRQGQGA